MPNFTKDDTYTIIKANTSSGLTGDRDDASRTTPAVAPKSGSTTTPKGPPAQPAYNPLSGGSANTGKAYVPPAPTYNPLSGGSANTGRAYVPTSTYNPLSGGSVNTGKPYVAPAPSQFISPTWSTVQPRTPTYGPPAPATMPTAPKSSYGPPKPSQGSSDPLMQALQKWQAAAKPEPYQPFKYNVPAPTQQVGLTGPRVDTGITPLRAQQPINPTVTSPIVATPLPYTDRAQDGLVQDRPFLAQQPLTPWSAQGNVLDAWHQAAPVINRWIGPVNQQPTQTGGLTDLTAEDKASIANQSYVPDFSIPQWAKDAASSVGNFLTPAQSDMNYLMGKSKVQESPILQPIKQAWQNSAAKEQQDYLLKQNDATYAAYKQVGLSDIASAIGAWLPAMQQNNAAIRKEFSDWKAGEPLSKSAADYWANMTLAPWIKPFYDLSQTNRPTALIGDLAANLGARIQGTTSFGYNYPSLPGNLPPSAYISSAVDTIAGDVMHPKNINPFFNAWDEFSQNIKQYQAAVTPTVNQAKTLSPGELFKDQQRAYLNTLGGLGSVIDTFDALVDRPAKITDLNIKAKDAWLAGAAITDETARQMYWTEAAKDGAEAYRLQNEHPQAIVFANMNLPRQMVMELILPDVTSIAGKFFELAELTPKARRLTTALGEVMKPEEKAIAQLTEMVVGPENMAKVMAERSNYNKFTNLWTIGTARADIATDKMFRYAANLLNGADTSSDARVLLNQLASDPAKLIKGVEAKLFQSPDLLGRAGEDGLIKFGSMGIENIKEPLRIYQQAAKDFLKSSKALNESGPLLNKVDFLAEFSDAMTEAGYKYFNVEGGGRSAIAKLNSFRRNIVSVPYIFLSPGTWATNIIGGVSTALGDGVFTGESAAAIDEHITKLFGVDPTMRGFEGIASAQSFINEAAPGGIFQKIKSLYGSIDEWTGKKVYHSAVTQALRKAGVPLIEDKIAPILKNLGMTDAKEIRQMSNQLFEAGYRGDNILTEFNKMVTGNVRKFAISDVNSQWLDAIPQNKLTEFYDILRTAPDRETALSQVRTWADGAGKYWDDLIASAPPTAQRHVWQTKEAAQDMADITQVGKNAIKYGDIPAEQVQAWTKEVGESFKATQARMETLTQMVADAGKPENKYVLYNIWGQVHDATSLVRDQVTQLAEKVAQLPKEERAAVWKTEYFQPVQQLWADRNAMVNKLMEDGSKIIADGTASLPNLDTWNVLERTARQNESKLWEALRLEPQSGTYDARLRQVMDAGRAISDKAVARTYAAARRFIGVDAMDYAVSAEHNVQMAGAQARSYLDKVLDSTLKAKNPNWENYFSIRNETWRQLRVYERDAWGLAERNIVRDGLAMEKSTGLVFNAGPDGMVELVDQDIKNVQHTNRLGDKTRVTMEPATTWTVKREDGTITTVPEAMVPENLKAKFKGVTPAQVEDQVQLELDNIASAQPFAEEAQKILNEQYVPLEATPIVTQKVDKNYTHMTPAYTAEENALDILQQARDQISGLEEARQAMRAEWDKTASAGLGLPKFDTTVMQYGRKGIVNVPENIFEDLYGQTIAGRTINGQADVEAFITDYAQMRRQVTEANKLIEQGAISMNELHGVAQAAGIPTATKAGNPNDQYLLNVINKERKGAGLRKITLAQLETDPVLREEAAQLLMNRIDRGQAPTINFVAADVGPTVETMPPPNLSQNLVNSERTIANTTQAGGTHAGELGLGAAHAKLQLKNLVTYLEQHMDEILTPGKGAIGEGQSLTALDDFRKTMLPAWDNMKFTASEYGNRMRSFTLIDNLNKTRLDELLGLFMPYGFWTTRTMKNSLERAIFEPQIWRRVMQADRDIRAMVDQNGDPARYSGAMPIDIGGGRRIYLNLSPAKYWSAAGLFTQNDYADPESANNALSFGIESMKSANLSPYPDIQIAQKLMQGQGNDIYPMAQTQQTRMLADMAILLTGSKVPALLFPGYFENTVARNLNNMAVKGQITDLEAKQAHDLMWQIKTGGKPLPEQANWDMAKLTSILDHAYKTSASDDLMAAASSWLTGVGAKPFDTAENTWRNAQTAYYADQYGPENPYGSHLASQSDKEFASLNWSKNAVGKGEGERPGVQLATSEKTKLKDQINDHLMQATEDWLTKAKKTPTNKEINDFKLKYMQDKFPDIKVPPKQGETQPFYGDIITAITDKMYPSAKPFEAEAGAYFKGYAPEEIKLKAREAAVYQAKKDIRGPQWPGDNASKKAKAQYYDAQKNYKKAIEKRVDQIMKDPNAMAGLAGMPLVVDYSKQPMFDNAFGPTPWRPTGKAAEPLVGLTPLAGAPGTAAEEIKAIEQKYMGPLEKAARDANDAKAAGYTSGRGGGGRRSGKHSSKRSSSRRGGGGGGGGYSSGGGGGGSSGFRWGTPIDPRYMQGGLWPDINFIQRWRPQNIDTSWLKAGAGIGPDAIKPWRPISWK